MLSKFDDESSTNERDEPQVLYRTIMLKDLLFFSRISAMTILIYILIDIKVFIQIVK